MLHAPRQAHMSIDHAVLGYLSWRPSTGYDLKKLFSGSPLFHWSGNSNQIYRSLVKLHKAQWVTVEVEQQESLPPRKTYHITESGRATLREWVGSSPELPQARSSFLVQLAWADLLSAGEIDDLFAAYEDEVRGQLLLVQEHLRHGVPNPARSLREAFLWEMLGNNHVRTWQAELDWVRALRAGLPSL